VGFEALVRWRHPTRGTILPATFIPIAEETGLIVPIGHQILALACAQLSLWQRSSPREPPLTLSINVSTRQLHHPGLIDDVSAILRETGLDAATVRLEITESMLMQEGGLVRGTLQQLRELGLRFALDDFGTGYSSLAYLRRFPIDALKIDQSFVAGLGREREDEEIVRAIILLARSLGMSVVAEGVETPDQLTRLRALECEDAQGFFFSRPVDVEAAGALLAAATAWEG
jgi:Amt family ammonium transporter